MTHQTFRSRARLRKSMIGDASTRHAPSTMTTSNGIGLALHCSSTRSGLFRVAKRVIAAESSPSFFLLRAHQSACLNSEFFASADLRFLLHAHRTLRP